MTVRMVMLVVALLCSTATAADLDITTLPRDAAKEAWVRQVLVRLGLSNAIRVVRHPAIDPGICAFAAIRGEHQYVAYDGGCVTSLDPPPPGDAAGLKRYWWSVGVMLHEISHHLGAHTSASAGKSSIERELEAERWVGWAFRYAGFPKAGAIEYARGGNEKATATHPGPTDRLQAVERGYSEAEAALKGRLVAPPASVNTSDLAAAARQRLRELREKSAKR